MTNLPTLPEECWSRDNETFRCDSLTELFEEDEDLKAGDTVYVGVKAKPDPADWIDHDDVIEQLACRAADECGEWADDYPEVSKEAVKELDDLLHAWARKYCMPAFYTVGDVREYVITEKDATEFGERE